jgi:hypothetical protein
MTMGIIQCHSGGIAWQSQNRSQTPPICFLLELAGRYRLAVSFLQLGSAIIANVAWAKPHAFRNRTTRASERRTCG